MARRLLPVAFLALSLAAVPAAGSAYGGKVLGPQRILVALVTWGPQPIAPDDVRTVVFDQVDAFYRAAMAAGGTDNGPPGLRPHYHPSYYGAFVLDPDGHNIEACCHEPQS